MKSLFIFLFFTTILYAFTYTQYNNYYDFDPSTKSIDMSLTIRNDFSDRLGNQLIQLNVGLNLADQLNATYCLDHSFKYHNIVNTTNIKPCEDISIDQHIYEGHNAHYQDIQNKIKIKNKNIALHGYFQSWRYMPKNLIDFVDYDKITSYNVIVHVRKGDKTNDNAFIFPPNEYFIEGLENEKNVLIITDDESYCKNHPIFSKYKIQGSTIQEDFFTLLNAKKIVSTSASTFAWYAGYSNKNEFIYYKDEVNTKQIRRWFFHKQDYYLPQWKSWPLS